MMVSGRHSVNAMTIYTKCCSHGRAVEFRWLLTDGSCSILTGSNISNCISEHVLSKLPLLILYFWTRSVSQLIGVKFCVRVGNAVLYRVQHSAVQL